jgi:hypothetical protein
MIWENILNGVYQAIGFMIITTVFGMLSWFALRRFIVKQIAEIWAKVKEQGFNVNVEKIDIKLDKKRKK